MFFDSACKAQLEDEIAAQFESFRATGLRLDHVNAHNHMHLHPTVFDSIVEIGRDFGLTAIRIPDEPPLESIIFSNRDRVRRYLRWKLLRPLISRMRKRCAKNNITVNDIVYGFNDSGHMNLNTLIHIIPHIADGLTEIYMHPATERWPGIDPAAYDYEFEAEYKALIHARVRRTIEKFDIELAGLNS
jgi:hopanoid biosynthesis associated protein HpnK